MKVIRPMFQHLMVLIFLSMSVLGFSQNQAPIANDDDNYGFEGTTLTGNLSLNDSDPNGDVLTYSVVTGPTSGTFTLQTNGAYSFVPHPEFNGFIYITVQACDAGGLCDQSILELAFLFVNDPPVIVNDVYFMNVNTTLNANVTTNDIDIDIEPIFATVLSQPAVGTLTMGVFGAFTYTPPAGFIGTVTFTYRGCDPCEVCGQATVTINVTAPNQPPIANDDETFTNEEVAVSGTVAVNDSDPEGMTLTYSVVDGPDHGEFILNANGTYTYTPEVDFWGFEAITYQVCDPFQACDQAVLVIEVIFVNDAPIINDESVTGTEDQVVMGNVAENDIEPDDEFLFYSVFVQPQFGSITMFNDGYFSFTPPANWFGTVTIVYFGVDPCGVGDFGTLTITINPVNDSPIAVADHFITDEDTAISGSVATNDSDVDSPVLTYSLTSNTSNGNLVLNPNGAFTFTPNANYFGNVVVNYQVCDNQNACANSTLTIQINAVNDPPIAQDDTYSTEEDVPVSGNVGTNDSDVDNASLTYTLVTPPAQGTLVLFPNGIFNYTPALDDSGVYTAVYQVSDGNGGIDQGTITFVVVGVNDALEALNDSFVMQEDAVLNGDVATNDTDPDGDVLTYTLLTQPTSGSIVFNTNGTFTYIPAANYFGTQNLSVQVCDAPSSCEITSLSIQVNAVNDAPIANHDSFTMQEDAVLNGNVAINDSDVDSAVLTFTVTQMPASGALVLSSNGSFTFTPLAHFNGVISFTYQVCDDGALCATAVATITVNAVNDIPVVVNDSFTTQEEVILNGNVSLNDSDADGESLVYTLLTSPVSGQLTLNANGSFIYTPVVNFFGTVSFTYSACDAASACANATATITVSNINDAPLAANDSFNVAEDGVLGGSVALNDTDPDGGVLTYSIAVSSVNGIITMTNTGSFSYSPFANYHGVEQVTYNVCDAQGLCDQGTLFITVVPVNDAPNANNDAVDILVNTSASGNVGSNDTDVDNATLTFTALTTALNGSFVLNIDGSYTYTPDQLFSGEEVIEYQACDGLGACDNAVLTITVINNNAAPVAINDSFSNLEDFVLNGNVALNDTDENPGSLVFTLVSSTTNGTLVFNSNGTFVYTPATHFNGVDQFTYNVCDMFGECDQAIASIQILPVDDAPIILNDSYNMIEDDVLNGNVAANDGDPDGGLLLYQVVVEPQHGLLTLFNDGFFSYTPNPDYFGTDSFVYRACDPCGICVEANVSIEIQFINDPPVTVDEHYETFRDVYISGNVGENDYDVDFEVLLYSVVSGPENGILELSNDGLFNYLPNDGWVGVETIIYQACDPCGVCTNGMLTIEVIAPNEPPLAEAAQFATCKGGDVLMELANLISDAEEDVMMLNITNAESADGEVIIDNANKILTFTPNADFEGVTNITYTVCDNGSPIACASAVIEVAVHQAPAPVIESFTVQDILCFGETNGSISLTVAGIGALSYVWNVEGTSNSLENLSPGIYEVLITDEAECGQAVLASFEITGPEAPLTLGELISNSIDEDEGGLSINGVSGGTEPYSYEWMNSDEEVVSTESILTGLLTTEQAGEYTLVVTDANGCAVSASGTVLNTDEIESTIQWNISPIPTSDLLNILIQEDGTKSLRLYNAMGQLVVEKEFVGQQYSLDLRAYAQGGYLLYISTEGKHQITERILLQR